MLYEDRDSRYPESPCRLINVNIRVIGVLVTLLEAHLSGLNEAAQTSPACLFVGFHVFN